MSPTSSPATQAPARAPVSQDRAVTLKSVRRMFEGVIPAVMCSVSAEGMPHLCFLSQVEYVDEGHVALSFQFFNRSRENILATRRCMVSVDDPYTAAGIRMQLRYVRTESSGPVFERMRAKLAGIAAHTGMDQVYRLLGADIYEVSSVREIAGRRPLLAPQARCDIAGGTRAVIDRISACTDMDQLLDETLRALQAHLQIDHSMILLSDAGRDCLYAIASLGYDTSGVGAEIPIGQGLAGICAREGVPLRIGHLAQWQTYARAIRQRTEDMGLSESEAEEIPLPGLAEPRSQLVVPLRLLGKVIGVLLVESDQDQYFSHDDEDALASIASPLSLALSLLQPAEPALEAPAGSTPLATTAPPASPDPSGTHRSTGAEMGNPVTPREASTEATVVHHHARTDSVFFNDDYVIKGVAGAILWRLIRTWVDTGRQDFSNRELRLDASLGLPDVTDNLEARLILLHRRLAERNAPVQLVKTGRGRFRLRVDTPLLLVSQD